MAVKKHQAKRAVHKPARDKPLADMGEKDESIVVSSFSSSPASNSSASLSLPKPPPIPSPRPALTLQQKTALIGGTLILVLVLGTLLAPSLAGLIPTTPNPVTDDNYALFKTSLLNNSRSAVIMDLRAAPSAPVKQAILQCGVDFISSGLYQNLHKDLLVYSCDETGCLSSRFRYDLGIKNATTTNVTIPYSDALANLAGYTYFHVQYAPQSREPVYTSQYSEVFITGNSSEACNINVNVQ